MPLHVRWQSRPWLMFVSLVALGPAAALWGAALTDSIGMSHLLIYLPVPAAGNNRPKCLLLLDAFFAVTLVLPLLAVLSGVLATTCFDLRISGWEITARVCLPRSILEPASTGSRGAPASRGGAFSGYGRASGRRLPPGR